MADSPDVTQMPTAGGNVNAPASGSYGEAQSLVDLQAALPMAAPTGGGSGGGVSAPPPIQGTPPVQGPSPTAGGLPQALLHPSMRPDVPVGTPLSQGPVNPMQSAATDRQRRLAMLDALTVNPNVSETTREWATMYRDKLIKASARG